MSRSTADKIRGFGELDCGWHHGRGAPITGLIQEIALHVEAMLHGKGIKTGAYPGQDGDIAVTGRLDDGTLTITIEIEAVNTCAKLREALRTIADTQSIDDAHRMAVAALDRTS